MSPEQARVEKPQEEGADAIRSLYREFSTTEMSEDEFKERLAAAGYVDIAQPVEEQIEGLERNERINLAKHSLEKTRERITGEDTSHWDYEDFVAVDNALFIAFEAIQKERSRELEPVSEERGQEWLNQLSNWTDELEVAIKEVEVRPEEIIITPTEERPKPAEEVETAEPQQPQEEVSPEEKAEHQQKIAELSQVAADSRLQMERADLLLSELSRKLSEAEQTREEASIISPEEIASLDRKEPGRKLLVTWAKREKAAEELSLLQAQQELEVMHGHVSPSEEGLISFYPDEYASQAAIEAYQDNQKRIEELKAQLKTLPSEDDLARARVELARQAYETFVQARAEGKEELSSVAKEVLDEYVLGARDDDFLQIALANAEKLTPKKAEVWEAHIQDLSEQLAST